MKKVVASAIALLLVLPGVGLAAAKPFGANTNLLSFKLRIADSNGRELGPIVDGLDSESDVFVLSEPADNKDGRLFLVDVFAGGLAGPATVWYTGDNCTGLAYAENVVGPEDQLIEVAKIGLVPATSDLAAFLVDPSAGYVSVDLKSYAYQIDVEYECVAANSTTSARKLELVRTFGRFVPPFHVIYR